MHEMSIALNIINIAEEELKKANGQGISEIAISVGKLSGVVVESLRFALDAVGREGPFEKAKIIIEEVPAFMKCLSCDNKFEAEEFYVTCPKCDNFKLNVLSGKELLLKSITVY